MQGFRDKVVIVTGGASGIGRALCQDLGAAGAKLVVADLNGEGAEAVAAAVKAEARQVNVREREQVYGLVQDTAARHGRLDYVFNNAGIGVAGDFRDLTPEHWQEIVEVNLMGVIYGCQAAYPLMAKQGAGHLVNVASLAGLIGFPGMVPYATTKAAVVGLSRSLRVEGQKLGVKVSVVCPGFIESNIYESSRCANFKPEGVRKLVTLPMIETGVASRKILQGVLANRELIVFPGYAKLMRHLYHLFPGLIGLVGQDMIGRMRQMRLQE
ncbi:MAG: SDR family NAD(P)-dependent oxidoreductase [Candidatus Sericytochromatia bacterium]